MKSLSCVILLVLAAMAMGDKPYYDVDDAPKLFEDFVKKYDKVYKDEADRQRHYEYFQISLQDINKNNAESEFVTFHITEFDDLSLEQKKELTANIPKPIDPIGPKRYYDLNDAPKLFEDFVKKYGKAYYDEADKQRHYEYFKMSLKTLNEENAENDFATSDITEFDDLSPESKMELTKIVTANFPVRPKPYYDVNDAPKLFEDFVKKYGKVYKDEADKQRHYETFLESLKIINETNAKRDVFYFDITRYADYTVEQRKQLTELRRRKY